jgi:hypothetical protein
MNCSAGKTLFDLFELPRPGRLATAAVVYTMLTYDCDGVQRWVTQWTGNAKLSSLWPIPVC